MAKLKKGRVPTGGRGQLKRAQTLSKNAADKRGDTRTRKHYAKSLRPSVTIVGRPRGCQFPLWPDGAGREHPDFGEKYCGEKVAYQAYCQDHADICWQAVPPRSGRGFINVGGK